MEFVLPYSRYMKKYWGLVPPVSGVSQTNIDVIE